MRRSLKNKNPGELTREQDKEATTKMKNRNRITQAISVAFIGCAMASSAAAKCSVKHPNDCVKKVTSTVNNTVKTVTHTATENTAAVSKGFTDATQEATTVATAGFASTAAAYSKYSNAAELATYSTVAQTMGYANLAAADAQAGVYGGYASLKARIEAESKPIVAADVAKFQAAYQATVTASKAAYSAASPYLKAAISDGTNLESLIMKSCKSGGQSSVKSEQAAMAPFINLLKHADQDDLEALNRILRHLLSGKTADQAIAHDLTEIGKGIGILKATGTSTSASNYRGSTWGLSVSVSGGWIGDGSWSAALNMNTEPFANGAFGYSMSTNTGVSFNLGTNDVEPGVTVGFGVSLGAGDSTAANEGVSYSLGMAAGAGLTFSSSLGWVFPNPTMDNLKGLFGTFQTAEKALVASTKKGVSGKDMLNAGYKVGSQAVDNALGPVISTIGTLCSLPGISIGMGINFSPSVASADASVSAGYSHVVWSGTI